MAHENPPRNFIYDTSKSRLQMLAAIVLVLGLIMVIAIPKDDAPRPWRGSMRTPDPIEAYFPSFILLLLFLIPCGLIIWMAEKYKRNEISFDNKKLTYYRNGKKESEINLADIGAISIMGTEGLRNIITYVYITVLSKDGEPLLSFKIMSNPDVEKIKAFFSMRLREEGFDGIDMGNIVRRGYGKLYLAHILVLAIFFSILFSIGPTDPETIQDTVWKLLGMVLTYFTVYYTASKRESAKRSKKYGVWPNVILAVIMAILVFVLITLV